MRPAQQACGEIHVAPKPAQALFFAKGRRAMVTAFGRTQTTREWSLETGLSTRTILVRLETLDPETALTLTRHAKSKGLSEPPAQRTYSGGPR